MHPMKRTVFCYDAVTHRDVSVDGVDKNRNYIPLFYAVDNKTSAKAREKIVIIVPELILSIVKQARLIGRCEIFVYPLLSYCNANRG